MGKGERTKKIGEDGEREREGGRKKRGVRACPIFDFCLNFKIFQSYTLVISDVIIDPPIGRICVRLLTSFLTLRLGKIVFYSI
mgnify:CR=1 FL=1